MYQSTFSNLQRRLVVAQLSRFTAAAKTADTHRLVQKRCHAPPSIAAVPADASEEIGNAGASIRPIGSSRRVFLLNAYLTTDEIEGLAYRIRALSSNDFLSCVLIASDDDDPKETRCLPAMVLDQDKFKGAEAYGSEMFDPKPGHVWHAAGGYDPLAWFKSGKHKDSAWVATLLNSVADLALATRGGHWTSRIPIVTIPHGAVTDSGYSLCLGTYMIATEQTHFRIKNLSRGLTFDPVGFSYILPRLGQEFNQPSAPYRGCGYILALMGYEASPSDMMETGLATHYMENPSVMLSMLERTLSQLPPWNQQRYTKTPPLTEAERQKLRYQNPEDYNFSDPHMCQRNLIVADAIQAFTSYSAGGMTCLLEDIVDDPVFPAALDLDNVPWSIERESELVNLAYTFDEIFHREATVEGLLESFREIAGKITNDPEEQEAVHVAADFVRQMEGQAPLALRVTHKLMKLGEADDQTFETCIKREKAAQTKLMRMRDYDNWGKAQLCISGSKSIPAWQHRSVVGVSESEVSEIIGFDVES